MASRFSHCLFLLLLVSCGQSGGYSPSYTSTTAVQKKLKIFVTTRSDLSGAIFGTAGADLYCNADAQAGNDTYKALIGTNTRSAPSTDWPLKANRAYYRIDGSTLIAVTDASAVFSGNLVNSVSATTGTVWTGFSTTFTQSNECTGFTATGGAGHVGTSDATTAANMISSASVNCTTQMGLYCVQQ